MATVRLNHRAEVIMTGAILRPRPAVRGWCGGKLLTHWGCGVSQSSAFPELRGQGCVRRLRRDRWRAAEPSEGAAGDTDLDRLRRRVDDRRAAVASRAVEELVLAHVAGEGTQRPDGIWGDAPLFVRFAARDDVPAKERAVVTADIAYALAVIYLVGLGVARTDPLSSQARWIAELAELGYRADEDSIPARSSLGLARLIQDRPEDARAVVFRVTIVSVLTRDHAHALAIRGFAEIELGDIAQARRLATAAARVGADQILTRALLQRLRMIPQGALT